MAMTATDPLSLLPTELRLKLYSIIFSPRPVLQIGRQWLSSSTVPTAESRERSRTHADGLPNLFSLRDHWTPYVEDAYLEGRYFTEPIYDHAYARTAMLAAKPDGRRTRDKIVLDAIGQRTGRRMDREQLPSYWNHLIRSPPIFSSLHVFHSRGSPRLQPLPRHFQSLMLLNKSFHKETVGYLYSEAVFDFGEDVDALLPFSTFIGPELADLIKYIRLDHVERLTRSGRKGTINCLNLLDIPLRTLLPNLKSLHLAISPWPHHSWAPKVPPWAMNVQELGRLLSTLDVNIRLSMGFESEIAFSDYNHHVALEANPTSKDELAQPQKNGSKPLDLNNLIHIAHASRIACTNMFSLVYELYNQPDYEDGPSQEDLLQVLYGERISNPEPGTLFPPLHPDEAERLRMMRYTNVPAIPPPPAESGGCANDGLKRSRRKVVFMTKFAASAGCWEC